MLFITIGILSANSPRAYCSVPFLEEAVLEHKADLGPALDGDADRFGVIDRNGRLPVPKRDPDPALHYLLEKRRWRGLWLVPWLLPICETALRLTTVFL